MKERLAKLLTVKSIVTIALTIVFCVLALTGVIDAQQFLTIFTTVIAFYFGTQVQKQADAAKPAAYDGSTEAAQDDTEYMTEAIDAATAQAYRPPDNVEDTVVTGFAG